MAGYSGTLLPKKLGIAASTRLALVDAPEGFAATLGELPEGVVRLGRPREADVVIFFTASKSALEARFSELARAIVEDGALWIAWPKKASKRPTDLDEKRVRAVGLG